MLAVVASVNEKKIIVRVAPKQDFSSCAEKGCHLCAAPTKALEFAIQNSFNPMYKPGELVILTVPSINEALVAALIFLTPLAVAAFSALVLHMLGESLDSGRSVLIILIAFLGSFAIPVCIEHIVRKTWPVTIAPHEVSC